jgi:hypothetical protein
MAIFEAYIPLKKSADVADTLEQSGIEANLRKGKGNITIITVTIGAKGVRGRLEEVLQTVGGHLMDEGGE